MGYIIKISFKNKGVQDMKIFGKELTFNGNKVYHAGNKPTVSEIGAAASSHTHNYAGSSSAGGAANSALTATKATQDSAGQQINTTYIKGLSVSGRTITYTKGNGTTGTITTQDTNTTYSTGTASTSGLTKLYTGTGTATDGTMTQAAINTALSGKADSSHTHNYAGSSSAGGAANSANTLATARTINGTSFNGSANITTANWGTARIITIGSTGKSVNGSGSVSWTLREIGAAPASHTHDTLTHNSSYYVKLQKDSFTENIPFFRPNGEETALGHVNHKWATIYSKPFLLHVYNSYTSQLYSYYPDVSITNSLGNGVCIEEGYQAFNPQHTNKISLGCHDKVWTSVWHGGLRSTSSGFFITAGDSASQSGRNGLWVNTTGFRPLNGDSQYTCGQNGFRWSAVWCVNGSNTTSDMTLKKNIVNLSENGEARAISNTNNKFYDFVKNELNFYSWEWKDSKLNEEISANLGVMAQELEKTEVGKLIVIPPRKEIVSVPVFNENGEVEAGEEEIETKYAINDRNMYMVLGIALQEAIKKIDILEKKIAGLEDEQI